jgi:hypothetical protein
MKHSGNAKSQKILHSERRELQENYNSHIGRLRRWPIFGAF